MITASRLATWKRVDRAVRALPQIVRDVPDALLLIVGDGEERERLEALARELGVIDHVRFAGAVPQDEVVRYMQASDVFLAPADLSNVGNPLLEAMACGLAIVTADAGDTGELVRDGETGRLLPDGDPAGIARAAIELARDASLRERVAAGARRYAETNFWTWDERLAAEIDEVERLAGVRQRDDVATRAGSGGR
jgi:glycosyltransferase involved in cell wall biosynthesis